MVSKLGQTLLHFLALACLLGQFVVETLFTFGSKTEIVEQLLDEALGLFAAQIRFMRHAGERHIVLLDERGQSCLGVLSCVIERLGEFALALIRLSEKCQCVVPEHGSLPAKLVGNPLLGQQFAAHFVNGQIGCASGFGIGGSPLIECGDLGLQLFNAFQECMFSPRRNAFLEPRRARMLLKLISRSKPSIVDFDLEMIQPLLRGRQLRLECLFALCKSIALCFCGFCRAVHVDASMRCNGVAVGIHSLDRFGEHLHLGRMSGNDLFATRIVFAAGVLNSLPEFIGGALPECRLIGDKFPDGPLKID
ncbi:hypothetical protein WL00_07735 [Burkholderia cepacia]|nr:hypothetical protein WL00_07735 [Burkholderia cepacia]